MTLEEAIMIARYLDPDEVGVRLFELHNRVPNQDVIRGLRLMLKHQRGPDWTRDLEAACRWLRRFE
jgi:hypothetical protein